MFYLRYLTVAIGALVALVCLIALLPRVLNPVPPDQKTRAADRQWINTSPHWLDRQACRWLSVCGFFHIRRDPAFRPGDDDSDDDDDAGELRLELRSMDSYIPDTHHSQKILGQGVKSAEQGHGVLQEIPDYVLKYAPLVHLYSGEHFWPSDIADHIKHMTPYADEKQLNSTNPLSLENLHWFDSNEADCVYMKSNDDVETRPEWLYSEASRPAPFEDDGDDQTFVPQDPGKGEWGSEDSTWYEVDRDHPVRRISDPRKLPSKPPELPAAELKARAQRRIARRRSEIPSIPTPQYKPDESGYSKAPATLVLVDKGSGIVDAFWFFFYAYNLGQTVLGIRFGNHVGDWEHCMIRFESGMPRAVFFSEHEGGQAYAWHAVEKRGNETSSQRPVIYSAVGSHAMYAMPGDHPYILPFNLLKDQTDRGPLWDPAKNFRGYWYDYTKLSSDDASGLDPVAENPDAPTDWFHYEGEWGDLLYGLDDLRQWRLFGQYHYVTGPEGPKFKNLGRARVCQTWECTILHSISVGRKRGWAS